MLEERVIYLRDALDEMRGHRDAWQTQAERLALTDERPQRPWWKRLTGRRDIHNSQSQGAAEPLEAER